MKFPTNNEEFVDLLISQNAAEVEKWVYKGKEFSRADVILYLFLREIWLGVENPRESTYGEERLKHKLDRLKFNPILENGKIIGIVQRMLAAGISSQDISSLISHHQLELVHYMLYKLDDTSVDDDDLDQHMQFGVYLEDEDEDPIPGTRFGTPHELLWNARPAVYPPG